MSQHSVIARVLSQHEHEHHLIALQDFPDLDDIASLAVHQRVSEQFSIDTTVAYAGRLNSSADRSMNEILDVRLPSTRPQINPSNFDGVVFLKSPALTDERLLASLSAAGVPTVMAIVSNDKHPELEADALILNEGRSTSALYANVLQVDAPAGLQTSPDYPQLATALMLGIIATTDNLEQASRADFRAMAQLAEQFRPDIATQLKKRRLSAETFEVLRRALTTRASLRGFSTAGVGYLSVTDIEALSFAAQFLLKEDQIHTVIAFAIVRDEYTEERLVGTLVTESPWLNANALLETAFKELDLEHFRGETLQGTSFEFSLGKSSRDLPDESQMVKWAYYEITVLENIAQAILKLFPGLETDHPISP